LNFPSIHRPRQLFAAGVLLFIGAMTGPAMLRAQPPTAEQATAEQATAEQATAEQATPVEKSPVADPPDAAVPMPTPRSERTLEYWADQLSHQRYLRRQSAQRHLAEGGLKSVPVLKAKLDEADLETVQNVISILAKIAVEEEPWQTEGAIAALESIAETSFGTKAALAKSTLDSLVDVRGREARAQLSDAGIFVGVDTVALGSRSSDREILRIGPQWDGDERTLAWFRWLKDVSFVVVEAEAAKPSVFQAVAKMPKLTTVVLVDADLNAETMQILADGPRLDALELRYVRLSEPLLDQITDMRLRSSLYLMGTGVTEDRVEKLRMRMPGIEITLRQGGFLGVICRSAPDDYCVVSEVAPGSGAAEAGLQSRDVIVQIDDAKITRFEDLQRQISTHVPGDKIEIRYLRDGQISETKATLKKLQDQ